MYVVCVFVCLQFLKIYAFNFDTNNPIVYVDPGKVQNATKSYFGYTVVLYPGSPGLREKWVKIGAPNGPDSKINEKQNPGVVYNCPFNMQNCSTVDIHKGHPDYKKLLNNAWIGGTMDIHYEWNRLAICAFRKINYLNGDYRTIGCCYISYLNITYDKLEPLRDPRLAIYENRLYYYGQGQAGFSAHFPAKENALILGAPGVYNWAGTAIKITDVVFDSPNASRYRTGRNKRELQDRIENVANAIYSTISSDFNLLGYAVNSGRFYGSDELYYVASAPKSNRYKGKIVIFLFQDYNQSLKEKESRVGSQLGEYFGASIAVGDINNDGCDDLIVGAPYHKVNTFNEGSVYIFLGQKKAPLKNHDPLFGQETNGQFGSSIMYLGDIDDDGYGDIAIGAPYEEDFSGVLYIYKGNKQGLERLPCQKIVGKDISPEIRGFGISISRPADMDENKYKDLAVGAHLSGNAVLLRSSPVIVIKYDIATFPKVLKRESRTFILQACYSYTHYNAENMTEINRTIIVDELIGRASMYNNQKENVSIIMLKNRKRICENITISLKNATTTTKLTPVIVSLSYELKIKPQKKEVVYVSDKYVNGSDIFCIRCPVLDKFRSTRPVTISIPFALDCGDDNACQSDLSIEANVPSLREGNIFVVGSMNYVKLLTTIRNKGENAYSTQLEVVLPDSINFREIPAVCHEQNKSVIICNVDDPLEKDKEKTIELDLEIEYVNKINVGTELSIRLRVLTTSNNRNNDTIFFKLQLKREADVTIYGKSTEQSYNIGNITHMPTFTQMYQVQKIGASPLEKVTVTIDIPHTIITSNGPVNFIKLYQPSANFNGQPVMCESDFTYIQEPKMKEVYDKISDTLPRRRRQADNMPPSTEKEVRINSKEFEIVPNRTYFLNCSMTGQIICSSVSCTGSIEKQQPRTVIQIKMMLNTSAIQGISGTKDLVVYSTHGSVIADGSTDGFNENGNRPHSVDVSSLFISEKKKEVALWIIILSAIAGILLLILIIFGLTKAGFFKRAKKEELKNLKAAMEETNQVEKSNDDAFEPEMNCSNEDLVDEEGENEK